LSLNIGLAELHYSKLSGIQIGLSKFKYLLVEKVDEFEANKYYSSKHPRSGHSQSVVSPDTTAVRSREKSTTPSVGKPSVGTQKIQGKNKGR
jgi:hypothetical protein